MLPPDLGPILSRLDNLLTTFGRDQIAVDLGCGRGSFHYESYPCRVIGIDVQLPAADLYRDGARIEYVCADSSGIPLADKSVDAVFSHHTMEHFPDYRKTLKEIDRVLKDGGLLWIAIPNGYSLDDALYRMVFAGGGHVNRFTHEGLISAVHELTRFRLKQEVDLYSSFIYLRKPTAKELQHFPASARPLYEMPTGFNVAGVLAINAVTRVADKLFGSRLSQYGWGFVFGREEAVLPPLHTAYFNVCSKCGSGIPADALRSRSTTKTVFGLGIYNCQNCEQTNSYVEPPAGLA